MVETHRSPELHECQTRWPRKLLHHADFVWKKEDTSRRDVMSREEDVGSSKFKRFEGFYGWPSMSDLDREPQLYRKKLDQARL